MMADGARMVVRGLAELQTRMFALPDKVDRKVVRRSVLEGAVVFRDEARHQAPEWHGPVSQGHPPPGTLKKEIVVKFVPEQSKGGKTTYYVTVRHGKGVKTGRSAFYWWFVEFQSTKNRNSKPFMRPAFELKKEVAKDAVINSLWRGVIEEAGK